MKCEAVVVVFFKSSTFNHFNRVDLYHVDSAEKDFEYVEFIFKLSIEKRLVPKLENI